MSAINSSDGTGDGTGCLPFWISFDVVTLVDDVSARGGSELLIFGEMIGEDFGVDFVVP